MQHTVILPAALVDAFALGPHTLSRSHRTYSFLLFAGSSAAYLLWSLVVARNSGGHWAYPVLDTPNVPLRMLLLSAFFAVAAGFWRVSVGVLEKAGKQGEGSAAGCPFHRLKAKPAAGATGESEDKTK